MSNTVYAENIHSTGRPVLPDPIGQRLCERCGTMHDVYPPGFNMAKYIVDVSIFDAIEDLKKREDALWLAAIKELVK